MKEEMILIQYHHFPAPESSMLPKLMSHPQSKISIIIKKKKKKTLTMKTCWRSWYYRHPPCLQSYSNTSTCTSTALRMMFLT